MFVDLGAEQLLGADKDDQFIAVEIKSFVGASNIADLEKALGQYALYRAVLTERDPQRQLYVAVPQAIIYDIFEEPLGQLLLSKQIVQVLGFDPDTEEVTQWLR